MIEPEKVKARDLMQTDLVLLHALTPIADAVETFEEYNISGAPVINEAGELVGVLAASDIVKSDHLRQGRIETERGQYYYVDPLLGEELDDKLWGEDGPFGTDDFSPDALGRETVGDWMTPNVISVRPEATLRDVCTVMARERIHRVFVLEKKRPVGVISTLDIVNYLADAL